MIFLRNRVFIPLIVSSASLGLCLFTLAAPKDKKKRNPPPNYDAQIIAAIPKAPSVQPKAKRNILVFSKTNKFVHKSIPTGTRALELLGEKTGAYSATISNDLVNFEEENINTFDTIIFLSTTGDVFKPKQKVLNNMSKEEQDAAHVVEKRLQRNLLEFIKSGKGFVGIHAASDTYYSWPEYGNMVGAYFDEHPWGAQNKVSVMVEKGKEEHPLVAHMQGASLNFKEEIYQFKEPYDSRNYDMLLRLDTDNTSMKSKKIKRTDKDFGVSWVKSYGKGRVFYCSLGHNHHIYYNDKVLGHYLAGIQYAMGDLELSKKQEVK